MKKIFIVALLTLAGNVAFAQTTPRWLRQNAISPDGKSVAFVYQGDIFVVPSAGGEALQLTSNPAHDTEPVWSADSKTVVFASWREGQKDIWAVSAEGGTPVRLTEFGGAETPYTVSPDGYVYFGANYQEDAVSAQFPGAAKLYRFSLSEALAGRTRVEPVSSIDMGDASVSADGTILYEDVKGPEDPFRKHHTSSVTRDIWKLRDGVYTKLSTFIGEDRDPVFAPDGKNYYFLSERSEKPMKVGDWASDSNIWKAGVDGGEAKRITSFEGNPVRFLSVSDSGVLCFSYNGDLYTMHEGGAPVKIAITIKKDKYAREHIYRTTSLVATGFAASPSGKEVAIVSRGDVYTTPLEMKDTRRITDNPGQERGVSFSKDGRTIYYASERNGEWGIWKTSLVDKKDKLFSFSYKTREERVSPEGQTCFAPAVSPDGKWVAYLRDRSEIVIRSTSGGKEKVLLPASANYSYSDGDVNFAWSPDSRYMLSSYQADGRMYNEDIALIEIETGKVTNLTESGYNDGGFKWALGGKAMTWETDKNGYRSHGSWGAEGDIYIMFFDDEAYLDFTRESGIEDIEKLLADDKKDKKKGKDTDTTKVKEPEKLHLELSRRHDRVVRLTRSSGRLGDHYLTPDGKKLYYSVQLESGRDLCCIDLKSGDVKVVRKGFMGQIYPSPDGKSVYIVSSLGISKADPETFKGKSVSFKGDYEFFPDKEREYIFDHCWKEVKEKWYVEDMHGVDWDKVCDNYRQFLPYITDNFAFREILSEMLGELNGSHTGGRYRHGMGGSTGRLGVIYDETYTGKGLRIKEFLPGSILQKSVPAMKEGDLILAVNGEEIEAGEPWYKVFSRKNGEHVMLTLKVDGKEKDIFITPASSDSDALYERWVRNNEKMVERLSGGRVGYVHVKGMNSESFRKVFANALGKYRDCEALIVDTRHNGGGWLHNDLATFLNGKLYTERRPRGVFMGPEPYDKWNKPSCVITAESNYSDACGFPYVYRSLGLGKIIGAPVPGTATSVWWETQIDPTLVFGIPQVGSFSISEGRYLENLQLQPDIEVYNDPASLLRGEDKQLEAAVAEMLKETAK